jgi:deoxycytidylate deaminase
MHAEQCAIAEAAQGGKSLEGSRMYTTLRPCLTCLAMADRAGVVEAIFALTWQYPERTLEDAHDRVSRHFQRYEQFSAVIELHGTGNSNESRPTAGEDSGI